MDSNIVNIKDYNYRFIMRVREALGYFDNIEANNNGLQKDSSINLEELQGGKRWNN